MDVFCFNSLYLSCLPPSQGNLLLIPVTCDYAYLNQLLKQSLAENSQLNSNGYKYPRT